MTDNQIGFLSATAINIAAWLSAGMVAAASVKWTGSAKSAGWILMVPILGTVIYRPKKENDKAE